MVKNITGLNTPSETQFTTPLVLAIGILGCEMYCTLFPCSDCLRAIVQSGMVALNTYEPPSEDLYFVRSFEVSLEMAREAGLEIRVFEPASIA